MTERLYAGIGSRETPEDVLVLMRDFGRKLAERGFLLRSGNADGADRAFATGANSIDPTLVELHLPWRKFKWDHVVEGNKIHITGFDPVAREMASGFHPAWDNCSKYARALHARNTTMMLGHEYDDPVDFVICWTPSRTTMGGTGQGVRIADFHKIPVINLTMDGWDVEFEGVIHETVKKNFRLEGG